MGTKKTVNLAGREVGYGQPIYIVAEGGVTNFGSLDIAKRQAIEARRVEADVIKYQAAVVSDLVSKKVSKRLVKELGYDWYQRLAYKHMSFAQLRELFDFCSRLEMPIFACPHDEKSLNFLTDELKMPFIKVGSGEAHNFEFLKKVAQKQRPVIIAFGMQSEKEILEAIKVLREEGALGIIALHCVTIYPTPAKIANLSRMIRLQNILDVPVGISDHTVGWHIPLAAAALGARVIEKHFTFDKSDLRSLDNAGALLPNEFAKMVSQIREIEKAMSNLSEEEFLRIIQRSRHWAGQSLIAKEDIPPGAFITADVVCYKRPLKGGLEPDQLGLILGKKAKKLIEKDEQITFDYLEG